MTSISLVIVCLMVFGINSEHITSAQQNGNSNTSLQRGRSQRVNRGEPISTGTGIRRRQMVAGPRHFQPDRVRAITQRLTNRGRQNTLNPTGSNRLRSVGTRRRLGRPRGSRFSAALHRQPAPTRSSVAQPSRSRSALTRLLPQLILARNLKVIEATRSTPLRRKNTQTERSNSGLAPQSRKITTNRSGVTTRNSRMKPPINGINNKMIPQARNTSRRVSIRPTVRPKERPKGRSPLRIRARLRQISNQGSPKPVPKKDPGPSSINNSKHGGKGSQGQGRRKDMIAIDDIISLVKAIKGSKEPSHVATQDKTGTGSTGTRNSKGKALPNNNGSPVKTTKSSSATTGSGIGGAPRTPGGPGSFDLLTQMALMSGEGGIFNSLLSDPSFLTQMSGITSDNSSSGRARNSDLKRRKKVQKATEKQQTSVIIHPSLRKKNTGTKTMKTVKTGNPVQDKMISTLLEQTMKNIREEIQENMRKRLADADYPVPKGPGSLSADLMVS